MGGKGSGGTPPRIQFSQGPTGNQGPQQQRPQQRPQQQQRPQPARQTTEQDRLRIGDEQLSRLYAPQQKPNPMAPLPARVGVRQERQAYNPELAFSQREIDDLYGYGPTFAIAEKDLQQLYGGGDGGMGSLLGDDDMDMDTLGEVDTWR